MLTQRHFARSLAVAVSALGLALIGLTAASAPAEARGHFSVFVGGPVYGPGYYYGPPRYYYPPPVVYAPPPAYYAPPPAYYAPPPPVGYNQSLAADPVSAPYTNASGQLCREYQMNVQIDGTQRPSYGTACQQPDGTWRIVN